MLQCSYDYSGYGASTGKVSITPDSFAPTFTSLFLTLLGYFQTKFTRENWS